MRYRQNFVLGAILIVVSELMFATMGATVKHLSSQLSNEMIVFMRNVFGLLVLLPLLWHRGLPNLKTAVPHLHILRTVLGLSAMYCFFYALAHVPLAEGLLLKMTAPFFMPFIAWLWLSERAPIHALLALPLGFAGVLLVLKPDGTFNEAALVGLLGGLLAAAAKVTVRRLGRTESTSRIVFYFAFLAMLISAVPLAWAWRVPARDLWVYLILMGAMGTAGQLLLTRAYAIGATARVAPFTYFSVVFGAVYGYLFWDEGLDAEFVMGALLISLAGVLALGHRLDKPAAAV